ncbi:branched-chain amino acid ABC transporter permease [Arthrobacter sp. zg-Y820]|uniref:branched-chain amino acid ABC transporter permease n=1 Tax=unclassified Arthrobacter TaxID=235627 RepID=UPI001E491BD1|nr:MULTISPECIES: branched-chain amino acid ABC transporter permease [unclassified Arthrobacter]MCC9195547.1 branched-chain amino acid ABC transporter permease [Arthrobacter sp. zg-Y820]MDK1278406.1 branched-chain amino acid ABC transporter permease [Arthrobacter sp. zg.Y820]MDK1360095.1 branched-chain amino acid ABC transporter permease [Arthrobacter sp. zg-Y1219]WIB11064.1 branched-chain amino acid ABC transporter permease [Arthrobacter sp. zg-Y820]
MLAAVAAMFAALLLASPAAHATTATPSAPPSGSASAPAADGAEFSDRISGVVRNEGVPVEGVRITASGNGYEAETVTGANGSWSIGVPEQGAFEVELDESSLPEGVALAEGQENPRTVTFAGTSNITTLFLLGEGIVLQQESFASILTERTIAGLSFGLLLALSAVGLSLIFGTTGLTNFAHGEMVTLGAVLAFGFAAMGMPAWIALPLAVVGGGAFGYVQDAGLWKPLRRRGTGLVPMMIVSIGLAVAVRYIILFFFGGGTQQLPGAQSPLLELGPVSIPRNTLISLFVSLAVILLVAVLLLRTRIGKATRAVSDNPALAAASGIDVDRVIRIVWVLGGALAAMGGILWAYYRPGVSFNMGQQILLLIFAGVTLGGLGTVYGALIGSVIVGLFVEISTIWLEADLKYVGALVIMILVLLVRPQGILGRRERIG